MTVRKLEDNGYWKGEYWIALSVELNLEDTMDLSQNRYGINKLINQWSCDGKQCRPSGRQNEMSNRNVMCYTMIT